MELCYKLNIPDFREMLKDEYVSHLTYDKMCRLGNVNSCQNLFKEEYHNFNNIEWYRLMLFPIVKGREKSFIHSDNWAVDPIDKPSLTLFAINFVIAGDSNQSYWLPSQLDPTPFTDESSGDQLNYHSNESPYKSYDMPPGAYLVNVTVPHCGIAKSNERLLASLRPRLNVPSLHEYWRTKTWEDIVNLFDKYIMK